MEAFKVIEFNTESKLVQSLRLFVNDTNKSENTKRAYNNDIKAFFKVDDVAHITEQMILAVEPLECQQWLDKEIRARKVSKNTINRRLMCLKSLYEYMLNTGIKDADGRFILVCNPFKNCLIKKIEKTSYGSFTHEEIIAMIKIANPQDALMISLLYKTGVRKEAIRNLNINENFDKIKGAYHIIGNDKTGKFKKHIGYQLYKQCKEMANEDGRVFTMGEGVLLKHIKGNYKYEDGYACKIGISKQDFESRALTVHSFKKSAVQTVLANGGTIEDAVDMANHSDPRYTLSVYRETNDYDPLKSPDRFIDLEDDSTVDDKLQLKLYGMTREEIIEMLMSVDRNVKTILLGK